MKFMRIKGKILSTLSIQEFATGTHYQNIRYQDEAGKEIFLENILISSRLDGYVAVGSCVDFICYMKGAPKGKVGDIVPFAVYKDSDLVSDFGIADGEWSMYEAERKKMTMQSIVCLVTIVGSILVPFFIMITYGLKRTMKRVVPTDVERKEAISYAQTQLA